MKRYVCGLVLIVMIALAGLAQPALATIANLAYDATGFGVFTPLDGGAASRIADSEVVGFNGIEQLQRNATNLTAYMTWSSARTIDAVRLYNHDYFGNQRFDRVRIDVLTGGDPTLEASWTEIYDASGYYTHRQVDIALGGFYTTSGLRFRLNNDGTGLGADGIRLSEVAVFGGLSVNGTKSLADLKVPITGNTASSASDFSAPFLVSDGSYSRNVYGGWNSRDTDASPTLTNTFTAANINSFILSFDISDAVPEFSQPAAVIPASYTVDVYSGPTLLQSSTYNTTPGRYIYYEQLTPQNTYLAGADRVVLSFANVSPNGIAIPEFELFNNNIPEPGTAMLFLVGGGLLYRWQRRRQGWQTSR